MLGSMKQMQYDSQSNTYGNATISGNITSASGKLYSNTVSTSQYLTFTNNIVYNSSTPTSAIYYYNLLTGTFTVTGNIAFLDILVVGAGGRGGGSGTNGNISGGNGGEVKFYPNVEVPAGTHNLFLAASGLSGLGNGISKVTLTNGISLTSNPGLDGTTGQSGTQGGSGNNGKNSGVGYYGGDGQKITDFANDVTWLGFSGNIYYGGGGSGINYVSGGSSTRYSGGKSGGGDGNNPTGYSPSNPAYTQGSPGTGGGGGAGDDANGENNPGVNGSGVIIIRHRSS